MIPRALILVAVVSAAHVAHADIAAKRLTAAHATGDADTLARTARTMTAAGIAPHLRASASRATMMAAIAAARHVDDAWVLLAPLASAASGPDRARAAIAARTAAAIADELDAQRAMDLEVPDEALRSRLVLWRDIGASPGRWPDVRVHAMSVARGLRDAMPESSRDVDAYDVGASLRDSEPEVRRAALELIAPEDMPAHQAAAVAVLTRDADTTVATVAAQVVCGQLVQGRTAEMVLAAVGTPGLQRIRALLTTARHLPPAAILDAARCLAADASPDSRRALATATRRAPRTIRAALRRLTSP